MTHDRRNQIDEYAEKLRAALVGDGLPVDVERLTARLGGTLVVSDKLKHEAQIRNVGPKSFEITILPWEVEARRRFAIAHELGHLLLHTGYLTDRWAAVDVWEDSMQRPGVNEEECDAYEFAGALLMPKKQFLRVARRNRDGDTYRIRPIAESFAVSLDAARSRGRWLNLFTWF